MTSGGHEVRAHLCESVIDEQGRWAQSTTQHCRYDGQPFGNAPAAIPRANYRGTWQVYGCFCSFSCAASFLRREQLSKNEEQRRYEMLLEVASRYFGLAEVHPALPLEALTIYGGYLELDEWRAGAETKHSTMLYEPPVEPFDAVVLERMQDWETRRRHYAFYYGRNKEERKAKEVARQQKLEQDMKAATSRETSRLKKQTTSRQTLWQTMGIQLVEDA